MNRILWWTVAALGAAAWTSAASAAPKVIQKISYYAISGHTARDLRAQMQSLGPSQTGHAKHWGAMTTWNVHWTYRYVPGEKRCAIVGLVVTVDIAYQYPRWVNEAQGDPRSRALWGAFLANLQTHEHGHAQHGIDAAAEVERALTGKLGPPNCEMTGADANARGTAIVQKYSAMDIEYDRVTGNGLTQGAYLPD